MREIKFRFWSKFLDKFVIPQDDILAGSFKDPMMAVMQYTGLKDKNGVEIYEGDIVDDLNHEARGTVVWQNDSCDYELEDGDGAFIQAFGFENSLYEVIGNIYENPELLEPPQS